MLDHPTMRRSRSLAFALGLGFPLIFSSLPAGADVIGPGFSVTGYDAYAAVGAGFGSAYQDDSLVGSTASALVQASPFIAANAIASATGLSVDTASSCCGGSGSANATASGKEVYQIVGGGGQTFPLTFDYGAAGSMLLMSAEGVATAASSVSVADSVSIISDIGYQQTIYGFTLESVAGGAPFLQSVSELSLSSFTDQEASNPVGFTASFSAAELASQWVEISGYLTDDAEATDGSGDVHLTMGLMGVTVPSDTIGPLPTLVGADGSVIQVTRAVPEPGSLALFAVGLIGAATLRRARRPTLV